jgi:MoxR-like ATPase
MERTVAKIETSKVIEIVQKIMGDSNRVSVDLNDSELEEIASVINKSRVRLDLSMKAGISVETPKSGMTITFTRVGAAIDSDTEPEKPEKTKPKSRPTPKRHQHTYVPPKMAKDIMDALLDDASHVLWFTGPTGTGKTVLAHYLASELGMELYQINCHPNMGEESFFGEKTIVVDEATGQNKIEFQEGVVTKAMQSGLDADGNEVGKPGLLFIDEAGAMPTTSIALNRLLESDDPRRTITLEHDGGRVVRSHSKFRIILAANTAGRGATDMAQSLYTAQMDALDGSLMNRVAMMFRFGYDRNVEKHIAMEKVGNDKTVAQILKFRDAIRDNIRAGKLSTPFSTRTIVQISDAYRIFRDLSKAIYYTTFEQLLPEEKPVYNEIAIAKLGTDILKQFVQSDIDYM